MRGEKKMRYISFAQDYEDIILLSALGKHVKKGNYVDIGANDPCVISVTKLFYDLGWRGMNIEPLEEEYQLLCAEREGDENINVGVSDRDGKLEFGVAGAGSSFRYTDIAVEKIVKPVKKFADLYRKSRFFGQEIHFCKIDVEGFEKNVLSGVDFTEFRPWIFVIESVLPATNISCYEEWEEILTANGYLCGFVYGANRYYVRRDKDFLRAGLTDFRKVFWDHTVLKAEYSDRQRTIRNKLDKAGRIVLFGAGNYMRNFFEIYGERYRPEAIVDNASEKQGTSLFGITVYSPEILRNETVYKNVLVLICCERTEEIKQQLEGMHVAQYIEYALI